MKVAAISLLLLASCRATPEEVVARARAAREERDMEALLACLTSRSADIVRGLAVAAKESRGALELLPDPFAAVPSGEVVETRADGDLTTMSFGKGRGAVRLVLLREEGEWKIDLVETGTFWSRASAR